MPDTSLDKVYSAMQKKYNVKTPFEEFAIGMQDSTNRRKEEHEDDTREMQLINLMGRLMGNQSQPYRPYMQQSYFPVSPALEELEPGGRVEFE